jgi:hypothetical protein
MPDENLTADVAVRMVVEDSQRQKQDLEQRKGRRAGDELALKASDADSRTRKQCSHCKKPGHVVNDCWKKHPEKMPAKFKKQYDKEKRYKKRDKAEDDADVALYSYSHKEDDSGADLGAAPQLCQPAIIKASWTNQEPAGRVGSQLVARKASWPCESQLAHSRRPFHENDAPVSKLKMTSSRLSRTSNPAANRTTGPWTLEHLSTFAVTVARSTTLRPLRYPKGVAEYTGSLISSALERSTSSV